jgi:putative transposon-encoded protein
MSETSNILLNDVKEYVRWRKAQRDAGREFIKKVTKFSNSSAAIYLPKRLIGQTFRVILVPVDDGYEISEPELKKNSDTDKLIKETEKDLERIQKDNPDGRLRLL